MFRNIRQNTKKVEQLITKKIVFDLPRYDSTSGGINETIKIANRMTPLPVLRFQRLLDYYPQLPNSWTVGYPDNTFPDCDACITFSDNIKLPDLIKLPQIDKVLIYMLSYGMSIERERSNVLNKDVTVMCSTKKLEKLISKEGVVVHRVGFALDMDEMYDEHKERKNYLGILYHHSKDKRYEDAVTVADYLYDNNVIDGVITFGNDHNYNEHQHPKGLVLHYSKANRKEVREIFNTCKVFIMPSISEGLNLTPIESTLCGCPAILCDGAIDEIFFNKKNCFVVEKNDTDSMIKTCKDVIENFASYSPKFNKHMKHIVQDYTFENVINNITKLIN